MCWYNKSPIMVWMLAKMPRFNLHERFYTWTNAHTYLYLYLYKMQTCFLQWTSASTTWMWYLTIMMNTLLFYFHSTKKSDRSSFFFSLSNSFIWILLVPVIDPLFLSLFLFFARSSYFHWANLTLELFLSFSLPKFTLTLLHIWIILAEILTH